MEGQTFENKIDSKSKSEVISLEEILKLEERIDNYFRDNKKYFESYLGSSDFTIESGRPKGLNTFAVDLENRVMYYSPRFFAEEGFTFRDAFIATCHEFEHIRELMELLGKEGGEEIWSTHLEELKGDEGWSIVDNCYDDIKMNKGVSKNAPSAVYEDGDKSKKSRFEYLYKEKLFPKVDLRDQPRHLQFAYAIVRDPHAREEAIIDEDVREEIEKLKNMKKINGEPLDALDYFSNTNVSMRDRLDFQNRYLKPIYEKLKEKDEKDKKFDDKEGDEENKNQDKNNNEPKGDSKPKKGKFDKYYEEYKKKNKEPLKKEDLEKEIKRSIERIKNKSDEEKEAEEIAKREGLDKKEVLEARRLRREALNTKDLDRNVRIIDILREQFNRIIAERKKKIPVPKYPLKEGTHLILPSEAYRQVESGNLEPDVWQDIELKEKKDKRVNVFDLHLVADLSGSMAGEKLATERRAISLVLEALAEFRHDLYLELEDVNEEDRLSTIRTEVRAFEDQDIIVKPLNNTLTERERIDIYKKLGSTGGGTQDYLSLQKIIEEINKDSELKEEIVEGKRRKVVIVTTDGDSSNKDKLKTCIKTLEEMGVWIFGVGLREESREGIKNYGERGVLLEDIQRLPTVFGSILDKSLESI